MYISECASGNEHIHKYLHTHARIIHCVCAGESNKIVYMNKPIIIAVWLFIILSLFADTNECTSESFNHTCNISTNEVCENT